MEFVQAQFSLKFEPQVKIRRSVNQIEDCLVGNYGTPQTIPIPDDFAAEAPRIVLNSHNGHSQISFSQISVDLTVNFDGEYRKEFELTKKYISARLDMLKDLLKTIEINQYYFAGISYNIHLDTKGKSPSEYMAKIFGDDLDCSDLYEASQRKAIIKDAKFFVNEQVGTFREYQSRGSNIPELLNINNSILNSEGVSLSLDVNDRYEYLQKGVSKNIQDFHTTIPRIYQIIDNNLKKWR